MKLEFDPHAIMRMKERDVLEEEVREAVKNPTKLRKGKTKNRYEAEKVYPRRKVIVIYDKIGKNKAYIITVY